MRKIHRLRNRDSVPHFLPAQVVRKICSVVRQVTQQSLNSTPKKEPSAGPVFKYDLSLPVAEIYSLVEATRGRLLDFPEAEVVAYGHLGDGNVHLNVSVPELTDGIRSRIEPFVYEFTSKLRGSISAEHGGRLLEHIAELLPSCCLLCFGPCLPL